MKLSKNLSRTIATISLTQFMVLGALWADGDRANRPLDTIAAGEIKIDVSIEIPLADEGGFFNPISVSPDIYYGINNNFSVGLLHSSASQGLLGFSNLFAGNSLALGDGDAYNNLGLEAQYTFLRQDSFSIAGQGGFYVDTINPDFNTSFKAGFIARANIGALEATVNPYIRLPLDDSGTRDNNFFVPVWLYYNLQPRLDLTIITGLNDEALMLGGGVSYDLEGPIDFAAHIGWPKLAGTNGAADNLAARFYASINL